MILLTLNYIRQLVRLIKLNNEEISDDFKLCWKAAGLHIQNQAQGNLQSWIRSHLLPPFLDHLSFRLGNQLFFIRIIDTNELLETPGTLKGLQRIANACNGHACFMPMRKQNGRWEPAESGWGMVDAISGKLINPLNLVTDELIEMTDWEVQDFAIQVIKDKLALDGKKDIAWNNDPEVQPSIWFSSDNNAEWVVVKFSRWPEDMPSIPSNINDIAENLKEIKSKGNFAPISIVNANDPFDPSAKISKNYLPLYRGHSLTFSYKGLIAL